MLIQIPTDQELQSLMGKESYQIWSDLTQFIEQHYLMDILWNNGGRDEDYELKFRRGGKTLCALYAREQGMRILIIFGKAEREKFEQSRSSFTPYINEFYDQTHCYHDGKWMYLDITNPGLVEDIKELILIKRKPNRKGE